MATKSFLKAMMEYFGLLPGQGALQFGLELKKLTYADKLEMHGQLNAQGITCDPPSPPAEPK